MQIKKYSKILVIFEVVVTIVSWKGRWKSHYA